MATNNADTYAHQVTTLSLSILRKHAYTRYTDVCEENGDELLSFKTWCIQQSSKVPPFRYWQTVYDMEMLLLRFVRSIRTEDLFLYEKSLDEIADWVFILDHYNYARWLPVHVRHMMNVRVKHPALYRQFADGFFTIAKTQNPFAMMGFDQPHEQQNKELKMHGGTLNLSDECVFTKWAVAGPEIARVFTEFEAGMYTRKNAVLKHHDHSPSVQQRFFAHTKALVIAFQEAGNPLDADSHEVVIIYTREVMPDNVARSIMDAHGEGKKQHADFAEHRLQSSAVAFHQDEHNQPPRQSTQNRNKNKHVDSTKEDMHLLGQLYMTMQVREGNSDRLFEVENADGPPSLSKHGVLRSGQKSDLLSCLEVDCPSDFDEADAKLIDGAHVVHFLRPDASIKSFRDYADKKVILYVERQLANTKRVDVIWDRYVPDSLKATTRQRRGAGIRQRMRHDGNGKFPRNWNSYLQNGSNKVELFHYLSVAIAETVFCEGKVVMSILDEDVLGSPVLGADESEYPLKPCNHE